MDMITHLLYINKYLRAKIDGKQTADSRRHMACPSTPLRLGSALQSTRDDRTFNRADKPTGVYCCNTTFGPMQTERVSMSSEV